MIFKRICKICFKDIKDDNLAAFINPKLCLCKKCYERLMPKFINFKVKNYSAISIYQYDEEIRTLLYQFKGCFDIELAGIFLDRYCTYYRYRFVGYTIIPVPSFAMDDEIRGFNHVQEMFSFLKLPMQIALVKTEHFKQASHNSEQRKEISNYLELKDNVNLAGKKVLIVDDVFTTGSTMKSAIKLIEKLHPKDIKIMVMSKTKDQHNYHSDITL